MLFKEIPNEVTRAEARTFIKDHGLSMQTGDLLNIFIIKQDIQPILRTEDKRPRLVYTRKQIFYYIAYLVAIKHIPTNFVNEHIKGYIINLDDDTNVYAQIYKIVFNMLTLHAWDQDRILKETLGLDLMGMPKINKAV